MEIYIYKLTHLGKCCFGNSDNDVWFTLITIVHCYNSDDLFSNCTDGTKFMFKWKKNGNSICPSTYLNKLTKNEQMKNNK